MRERMFLRIFFSAVFFVALVCAAPAWSADAPKTEIDDYSACAPGYAPRELHRLMSFVNGLSPKAHEQLKKILLECDYNRSEFFLSYVSELRDSLAAARSEGKELYENSIRQKRKDLELLILTNQPSPDEAKIRALLNELFDLKQQRLEIDLAMHEDSVKRIKALLETRKARKKEIVERKLQGVKEDDPLAW